jgi:hypothetical protein
MPSPLRSRASRLTATVALLGASLPGTAGAQDARSAQPGAATLTAAQWREDLRTMMDRLPSLHNNLYHATSKASFDSAARELDARIPTLSREEIVMEMARIVALAGDGHTNIYPTRDAAIGFHALPVALYLFRDGLYVRAADSAHAELVGARVVRIGSASADEALARIRPYVGRENDMGIRYFAPHLLAMPEVLHALHLTPNADGVDLELETRQGRRTVRLAPTRLADLMAGDTDRSWRRKAGWVDARDAATAPTPLWLRIAPDTVLWWFTTVPGTHAVYAQLNQIRDADTKTLDQFADELLAYIDTAAVDRLVLDLRLDRGGNGGRRMGLVRGLLRQPKVNAPGKLLVLIGRATFSAAQFLVDDLDKYSHAVFVGEPTASRGNHYGDSRQIKLPNSGITVRASVYYWQDWAPTDDRPWTAPEVAAELTFAAYAANQDPALEAALAYQPAPPLADRMRTALAADDTLRALALLGSFRADDANAYADVHSQLDAAALWFYDRKDVARATWMFALAAREFPGAARAHRNLAAMYQRAGRPDLERRELGQVLRIEPGDAESQQRLRELGPTGP